MTCILQHHAVILRDGKLKLAASYSGESSAHHCLARYREQGVRGTYLHADGYDAATAKVEVENGKREKA